LLNLGFEVPIFSATFRDFLIKGLTRRSPPARKSILVNQDHPDVVEIGERRAGLSRSPVRTALLDMLAKIAGEFLAITRRSGRNPAPLFFRTAATARSPVPAEAG
jgi:hypothetical protein